MSEVNGSHMQVVAIGMHLARKHLSYVQSLQSTLYTLNFFECIYLQSCRGKRIADLLRRKVEINVLLKPFIRNVHLLLLLKFRNLGAKLQKKHETRAYMKVKLLNFSLKNLHRHSRRGTLTKPKRHFD